MSSRNNPFLQALRSAPRPGKNEMVFPYDYSLRDYNTNTFNATKFEGAIQRSEIEEMKIGLRNAVTNFEVSRNGNPIGGYVLLGSCGLGILLAVVLAAAGLGPIGSLAFWACIIFGVLFAYCGQGIWTKKLLKREREVRDYLNQVNSNWMSRGLRWTTSRYGAYLLLTHLNSTAVGGGIGLGPGAIGMGMPMTKPPGFGLAMPPGMGPRMPPPMRPAPMGGFRPGFNQPAPPRMPMQPVGGYRPSPYQPVGSHQVAPLPLNPPASNAVIF